jgi:hypothetical protein
VVRKKLWHRTARLSSPRKCVQGNGGAVCRTRLGLRKFNAGSDHDLFDPQIVLTMGYIPLLHKGRLQIGCCPLPTRHLLSVEDFLRFVPFSPCCNIGIAGWNA